MPRGTILCTILLTFDKIIIFTLSYEKKSNILLTIYKIIFGNIPRKLYQEINLENYNQKYI